MTASLLSHLVERVLAPSPALRPRRAARFEARPTQDRPVEEAAVDETAQGAEAASPAIAASRPAEPGLAADTPEPALAPPVPLAPPAKVGEIRLAVDPPADFEPGRSAAPDERPKGTGRPAPIPAEVRPAGPSPVEPESREVPVEALHSAPPLDLARPAKAPLARLEPIEPASAPQIARRLERKTMPALPPVPAPLNGRARDPAPALVAVAARESEPDAAPSPGRKAALAQGPAPEKPAFVPAVEPLPPRAFPAPPTAAATASGRGALVFERAAPEPAAYSPPPAPDVHISIGRVEIRAVPPAAPARASRSAAQPAPPSLADYLARRDGRRV